MKKLVLILAVFFVTAPLGLTTVSAQEKKQNKEKVVTGTIQLLSPGSVKILDGYISNQLYTGSKVFTGLNVKLGALYKKHDNLSWDVYFTGFNRAKWMEELGEDDLQFLKNPSKSQSLKYTSLNFGYGTYYNWKFGEKLLIKAGGMFDVYGAMKTSSPDGTNTNMNMDAQMMFKGHAAIKYGWDFKKWALDLRGSVTLPAFGLMLVSHPSESVLAVVAGNDHSVLKKEYRHTFLASYHNYMSVDYELGIDFVFRPCTLSLGYYSTNKWWKAYDLPYICKINCIMLGISFDMVSRNKFKTSNINF